jgi:glycosyltransferase involved in cell wall biosynthesis
MKKKKKILILNYEFPPLGGGASPVSYEIAKGYVKLGHKVDVVTMGFKGLKRFEVKDGINIYRVRCLRSRKEICHPWEQLTYIFFAKRFLKKHLKTNSYDINHTHFIIPTGIVSLWLKKKYGLEYIITSHGSDVLGYNKRFKKIYPFISGVWKKIVKEAKLVVTPSAFLGKEIKKITEEFNHTVIPNGVDTKKFRPMKKEKYILVVARLFENKGVQDILEAMKNIDLKDWKVLIVGDGPYREVLEKQCKEAKLEKNVKFLGWVDNKSKRMQELYGKASIFISASYFENMSMVLLEAIAAGCYVIASDVGGNPEVVSKENLFKVKKPSSLSKCVSSILKKKHTKTQISRNFLWENIVNMYQELI